MAYFSNGSEALDYEQRYCDRCIHQNCCAVWLLHLLHNYDECNNAESMLHTLIPRSPAGLDNEQCTMFLDETLLSPLAREKFKSASPAAQGRDP